MTREQIDAMLGSMPVSACDDGWVETPPERNLTRVAAHDAVALTVSTVQGVQARPEFAQARTHKGERTVSVLADAFAISLDGSPGTDRKTGFAAAR